MALNLAINDVGIGLGDTDRTTGVRVNYGDTCLQTANGINATILPPFSPTGTVNGLALGLPLTGSARLRGVAVGVGLFFGNAGDVRGSANGLLLGGIATVSESPARGVLVGGLGAGVGASATGVVLGGGSAVSTAEGRGLFVGGLAAGTGDGTSTAVLAGGLASGTRGHLRGAALSFGVTGARQLTGLGATGGYLYIHKGGALRGVGIAAATHVRGTQRGLTIGLINYARELHGVQIGLLNIARNNSFWRTILPVVNFNL